MPGFALKLDLHTHTHFSSDGVQSPADLLAAARERGIDCVAITDHNTIRGGIEGLSLAEADPSLPRVIPGVELATLSGEVIGLFVSEEIPRGLSAEEAVARIREQGGIVYLPHPFDKVRRGAVSARDRVEVARMADIVEVVNGRALWSRAGSRSSRLAAELDKPAGAGSDAHRCRELGSAYVLVDAIPTAATLIPLVVAGKIEHHLGVRRFVLNWGRMGRAPITRARRRIAARWPRRSLANPG